MYEGPDPALTVRSPMELELLLRASIHSDAPAQVLARLRHAARVVVYPAGARVLTAGERPQRLVVIVEGEVDLGGQRRGGRGVPLGVLDLLIGRPHPHDVIAATPLRTLQVQAPDYLAILDDHIDVSLAMIDKLAVAAHGAGRPGRPGRRPLPAQVTDAAADDPIQRLLLLRAAAPFARASVQAQASLAGEARPRRVRAGEILFLAEPDTVWMVASGVVRAGAGDPRVTLVCGPGEPVGGAAAFAREPWVSDAVAATDAVVLGIDREALLDRMEEHASLARSVISYLGWIIATATDG